MYIKKYLFRDSVTGALINGIECAIVHCTQAQNQGIKIHPRNNEINNLMYARKQKMPLPTSLKGQSYEIHASCGALNG